MAGSKSVKPFNLENRKNSSGSAVTKVDIFQWKNTLIDNLKRETDLSTERGGEMGFRERAQ